MPSLFGSEKTSSANLAWIKSYTGEYSRDIRNRPNKYLSRTESDILAAWSKWHVESVDNDTAQSKRVWYIALERARVETLACSDLRGIKSNLQAKLNSKSVVKSPTDLYLMACSVFGDSEYVSTRSDISKVSTNRPFGIGKRIRHHMKLGRVFPRPRWIENELIRLRCLLDDQKRFQLATKALLRYLPDYNVVEYPNTESGTLSTISLPMLLDAEHHLSDDVSAGETVNDIGTEPANTRGHNSSYQIFDDSLDEVGHARRWLSPSDYSMLSLLRTPERERIKKLSRLLQKRLLTYNRSTWRFDLDQGKLDSRRLSRLVTSHGVSNVFRQKSEGNHSQACVCFLIDLSGSMSQKQRVMAALTLDFVLQALDQCAIKSEALAYTTRFFSDNPLVEEWQKYSSHPEPGRLNAIRHVILKGRNEQWKSTRNSLALLLKKNFGGENFDGEALDWAVKRISKGPEQRKVLIVLSDGEPFDEATIAANGSMYLEEHLRAVIDATEKKGIQLSAIGFSSNMMRFFKNVIVVRDEKDLPAKVFDQVGDLITHSSLDSVFS